MILPLVAVGMVAMFAMAGLALDAGRVYMARTQIQNAADAAALAAAREFQKNGGANVVAVATNTASANGFTNGVNNTTVTVASDPSGYPGSSGYVRVTITQPLPTSLSAVIGINALAPRGSAVGGPSPQPLPLPCLQAMPSNPGDQGIVVSGGGQFVATNCPITVKSTSSKAIEVSGGSTVSVTGSGAKVYLGTGGSWNASGGSSLTPTPTTKDLTNAVFTDPFAALPTPVPGACDYTKDNIPGGSMPTFNPGTYCGKDVIKLSGGANAIFRAGIYILTQDATLDVSGGSSLTGNGVFFYLDDSSKSSVTLSGGGAFSLSAPTSGPYQGMLFWQAGSKDVKISGGSDMRLNGNLYFPAAAVELSGGSGSNQVGTLVGQSFKLTGGSTVNISPFAINPGYMPAGGLGPPILFE